MRYIGGNFVDPVIEDSETIFEDPSQVEFEKRVEEHLEYEDSVLHEIKVADSQRID